jgi:hypothetical protein
LAAVGAARPDVFATGPAVRDGEGRIIGCQGLSAGMAYRPAGAGVFTTHTYRSTNGRWGLEISVQGAQKLDVPSDFIAAYRGEAVALSSESVVIEPGDEFVIIGGDLMLYEGAGAQVARVDLQSNREVTVLRVSDGDVVISYGYKRRSSEWYRAGQYVLVPLTAAEKALVKGKRRRAAIVATFNGEKQHVLTNFPAKIDGKLFWANAYDGSEPRQAQSVEELITWAEEVGPLAEWKIG